MTDFGGALKKQPRAPYEFALVGVPFDGKESYLKGPRKAPQAIREASTSLILNAWTELGVDLEEETRFVDLGDLKLSDDYNELCAKVASLVEEVASKGAVPVILGGDHSISLPVVRGLSRVYEQLDILHFDAHPDLYVELYGDRYSHACPFYRIMEEGLAAQLVQIGVRAVIGEHREHARQFKIRMVEMKDLASLEYLEFEHPLYISFDIDVLDPAFAPGVSHPEPGGMTTRQAIDIIHHLQAEIIGLDLVEVNPEKDPLGITAAAAVKIIMEIMGQAVIQKHHRPR
jgi:agmatinase